MVTDTPHPPGAQALGARECAMTHPTSPTPLLLPELAFVVQFREGTDLERGRFLGRVEHVVSGQATRFQGLDELVTFMTQVLARMRAPPLAPESS